MGSPLPSRGYIRVERVASGDIDDGDFVAGVDFVPYQVVGEVIPDERLVDREAIDIIITHFELDESEIAEVLAAGIGGTE